MITKEEIIAGLKSRDVQAMFGFMLVMCLAIAFDHAHGVPIYLASVLLIAIAVSFMKKDRVRVAGLLAIVVLSFFSIGFNGVKFGIDFSGGVRIPVLLETPVDPLVMEEMVSTIKTRAAAFGLTEVKVRPIGDSEIYVELPQSSPQLVKDVETVLSQQGVYQGVVDGKVAIKGDDIYTGTISRVPAQYLQGADWAVSFTVTQGGAKRFSQTVQGKANYPLFMFLDRPDNAIIVLGESELMANSKESGNQVTKSKALELVGASLRLDGNDIEVYIEEEIANNFSLTPKNNMTKAIVLENSTIIPMLADAGFVVIKKTREEMSPEYQISTSSPTSDCVSMWKAVGLLSAPRLVASVTEGVPSFSYLINGPAQGDTPQARALDAIKKERELESILKGGALPVHITIGSKTLIPAPLGAEFLRLSLIGIVFSLLAISLMVAIRYRHFQIVLPMICISVAELVILIAILGSFTIDLSAMAGIMAAIGVGIDAQIVVTDELLKKEEDAKKRMEKAFSIITTSVMVAVVAMLPLLLMSGLVEIIGFATSTILGSVLGLFISRPAYGAIVEHLFD